MTTAPPETAPLIPRDVLFGNPDRAAPLVSPDGSRISYLAPLDGVMNVWVAPADDLAAARPVTRDRGRGIMTYFWACNSAHLLYLQDRDGDENYHVYRVDPVTEQVEDLTPFENARAAVVKISHRRPDEILVGVNHRDPQFLDVLRVNLRTGERTVVFENDRYIAVNTDDDLNVRFGSAFQPDFSLRIDRLPGADEGEPQPFLTVLPEDLTSTGILDFDRSGAAVYMLDSRGRDRAALVRMEIATRETEILFEAEQADVSDVLQHPTEKTVQAAAVTYARTEWTALDPAVRDDLGYLRSLADGEFSVAGRTLDDRAWIVVYVVDDGPVRYYRYDRGARRAELLFTNRKELEGLPLAKMRPVEIPSRDGLTLLSYLTLPHGSDRSGDGRPEAPLPLVLWVHGGPWARDTWGYNPVHQWLANRGYAVLSVNFRGSTGFGKAFVNAANREWGGRMHDDLLDAVDWAVRERIADPARVAIAGGSYGGYAALAGVTFTPEKFAAGVSIVGPSNLITFMNNIPPYWVPMLPLLKDRVGDPTTEEGRRFLTERSPLTYVERICRPLLIGQGANDPRVVKSESDQIVAAMQERGIPVTYVLYPDEGHGFARPENRLSFFAVMEAFLAAHLGGRAEPVAEAFRGSSAEIPVGAEEVAGLGK
jgi:dipeptidyl aminopeptidase/acylaminoacyl peptidase